MKIVKCIQGTPEWFNARCGIPSASNFDKILTAKGEISRQRTKYLYQLAGETVIGIPEEEFQNGAMLRGKETEAEAREFYQLISRQEVKEVGFCIAEGYGASPDGLVGKDGIVEIKCPTLATHVGYLLDNILPADYIQQVQGQLLVTGRKWCDFLSYYTGLKPLLIRVPRDEKFIKLLQTELKAFCAELVGVIEKIR